jgi:hypothetical protein
VVKHIKFIELVVQDSADGLITQPKLIDILFGILDING